MSKIHLKTPYSDEYFAACGTPYPSNGGGLSITYLFSDVTCKQCRKKIKDLNY